MYINSIEKHLYIYIIEYMVYQKVLINLNTDKINEFFFTSKITLKNNFPRDLLTEIK